MGWIFAQFETSEMHFLILDVGVPTTVTDCMQHLCSGRVYNLIKRYFCHSILTLALFYTIQYI